MLHVQLKQICYSASVKNGSTTTYSRYFSHQWIFPSVISKTAFLHQFIDFLLHLLDFLLWTVDQANIKLIIIESLSSLLCFKFTFNAPFLYLDWHKLFVFFLSSATKLALDNITFNPSSSGTNTLKGHKHWINIK